jgi:glycosyltransferase involved in cell wall biosynthesis
VEHIVQDAGSDDGTLDWLPSDRRVKAFVEKDKGMYDAVNRGWQKSKGEILAYLNCDEQYLPRTLARVGNFFERHPEVDLIFGHVVVVDAEGKYLYHRKVQVPLKYHTWTCHLSTLSCATFLRSKVFFDLGFKFDTRWRDVGDGEWMVRMLRHRVSMCVVDEFTSVFTQTGANMSAGTNARREALELRRTAPNWAQWLRPLLVGHHRLRRFLGGMYSQRAFSYEIFTRASPERRQMIDVSHPISRGP